MKVCALPCSAAVLVLAACGPSSSASELAAFHKPSLTLTSFNLDASGWVKVQLGYEEYGPNSSSECRTAAANVTAKADGVALSEVSGGWGKVSAMSPDDSCLLPTWTLRSPDAGALPALISEPTEVTVSDGKTTLSMSVHAPCAPRSFSVSAPADSVLHTGQSLSLTWLPATDNLSSDLDVIITYADQSTERFSLGPGAGTVSVSQNVLSVTPAHPVAGVATVAVGRLWNEAGVESCGVRECYALCTYSPPAKASLTVAP